MREGTELNNLVKMLCLLLLTLPLLGAAVPMIQDDNEAQIVGGDEAQEGEFPWQVSLRIFSYYQSIHICGGSLIHPSWILTAAHCFPRFQKDPSNYMIQLGQQNLYEDDNLLSVKEIIIHPNYKHYLEGSDLALIKLYSPVQLTETVNLITLPKASQTFTHNMKCWLSGWGDIASDVHLPPPYSLRKVQVPLVASRVCDWRYHLYSFVPPYKRIVRDNMICAGQAGKSSCQGDSGGALVCKVKGTWLQAGIVSWAQGCAAPLRPTVFTRVTSFVDWINQHIQESSEPISPCLPSSHYQLQS